MAPEEHVLVAVTFIMLFGFITIAYCTQYKEMETEVINEILRSLKLTEGCISKELPDVKLAKFWSRSVSLINICGNSRGFNLTAGTGFGVHMFSIPPHKDSEQVAVSRIITEASQLNSFTEDDTGLVEVLSLDMSPLDQTMFATFLSSVLLAEGKVICQMNLIYPQSSSEEHRENWLMGMKLLLAHGMVPLKAVSLSDSTNGSARVGTFLINMKDEECHKRYLYY